MLRVLGWWCVAVLVCGCARLWAAPPTVDYLFPGGMQRGATTTVTVGGKLDPWPAEISVDRPGLTIEPGEKAGQLQITAPADAPAGRYWIRLHNAEGAALAAPFWLGDLSEQNEQEPNDELTAATPLPAEPTVANGQLARGGDVDVYAVEAQAGQTLVASLAAHRTLGSPVDAVLQIVSPRGRVLLQSDDARGLDPELTLPITQAGTYRIRVYGFPADPNQSISFAGAPSYVYRLTVTTGPAVDHTQPLAIGPADSVRDLTPHGWNLPETPAPLHVAGPQEQSATEHLLQLPAGWVTASVVPVLPLEVLQEAKANDEAARQALPVPGAMSGSIADRGEVDRYEVTLTKGQAVTLSVASRTWGYELDPLLAVHSAEGKRLAELDDTGGADPQLDFTAPEDGTYQITVTDRFGSGGARYPYLLSAVPAVPDFTLTLPAETYSFSSAEPLEIVVTIARLRGLKTPLRVRATELPPGVTCEEVISQGEGDTAAKVTLKLVAATGTTYQGAFQVSGSLAPEATENTDAPTDSEARTATAALRVQKATTSTPWLTVTAPPKQEEKK